MRKAKGTPTESRAQRIERVKGEDQARPITLSTGVVVQPQAVSPFVINAAMARIEKPKVPRQMIEGKGREEENPMHPDYLAAMEHYEAERGRVSQEAMLMLGLEVLTIPQGFQKPEDTEWTEELEMLGVEVSPNGRRRKLDWLRFWAMRGVSDLERVATAVSRLSGVPEVEVQKAADSFRGKAPGGGHSDVPAAPSGEDGDSV